MFGLIPLSITSFSISLGVTFGVKQSLSQKLLDIPNDRSTHQQPTPRGGGLGFVVAFLLTDLIFHFQTARPLPPQIWLFLTPLILVSLIDDYKSVPAALRYLVQLTTSTLVVLQLGAFPLFGLSEMGTAGHTIAIALTAIGMTALINFYNFMDGLDGFVASISLLQLGYIALQSQQSHLWLLVAALAGFLCWNWAPAKIFMGDVGSTFLGAIVAIALLSIPDRPALAWSTLAITLPITADTIYTLIRRLSKRENIFQSHRSHLFQRLYLAGWSHPQVTIAYLAITLAIAILLEFAGTTGAWISLAGIIATIGIGELYLHRSAIALDTPPNLN